MQGIPGGGTLLNNHQHDAMEAAIECIGFSLLTLSGLVPDLEINLNSSILHVHVVYLVHTSLALEDCCLVKGFAVLGQSS